jgi:hypothetical protein
VPRLYHGRRLTTVECLDWLWQLKDYAYAELCLFGASYDINNWLRDIPFDDVKRLADAKLVRVGNYLVLWMQRFKFELRLIVDEDDTRPEYTNERYKYARVKVQDSGFHRDAYGLAFWDVQPWWQTSFIKAADMTLKDRVMDRDLLIAGKEARGSFTYDNIEWVSRYNKAECRNLAYMMVELDKWFQSAGIKPLHYNGPGAAAKAMLRRHAPYYHAGRRIDTGTHRGGLSNKVREYVYPGADSAHAMSRRALSAYAGGMNRIKKIGYHIGTAYQYDIISAYPYGMTRLPCLSHGEWQRTSHFDRNAFALWKVQYKASKPLQMHPFFYRLSNGTIEYPYAFDERWCYTSEVAAALAVDANGVTVLDGWKWVPGVCDDPFPMRWIDDVFKVRLMYKQQGNDGASHGLKYPLNSAYGSIAQARGGTLSAPPWSQQLMWAGAITAYTRTRLYLAHATNPDAVVHMATDGIISLEPLPLKIGAALGDWEVSELTNLSVVQYGVYFAESCTCGKHPDTPWHHRERGFKLTDADVPAFVQRVHDMWRTGKWVSLEVMQHIFVTAGLVAMAEKRYDEWCEWQDQRRIIELDSATIFNRGHVASFPGMYPLSDGSKVFGSLQDSTPYEPHWGKGDSFPRELRRELEYANAAEIQ